MTQRMEKPRTFFDGLFDFWTRHQWRGEDWRDEQIEGFLSSYGSWPGHHGDYAVFARVLWEMGKEEDEKREAEKGRH
jgi:hypothetical protein